MLHGHRRAAGNEQIVFNPFGLFGVPSRGNNPLASLNPRIDEFSDDAMEQSEGMIEVGNTREPHFPLSFQDFLAGLSMFVRLIIPGGTYADVRALATLGDADLRRLVMGDDPTEVIEFLNMRDGGSAKDSPEYEKLFKYKDIVYPGMIAAGIRYGWPEIGYKASRFMNIGGDSRELHGILSTGMTQTRWIDSRAMQRELAGAAFDFAELKRRPMTVWLILPDRRLSTHAKWLRLTLTAAMQQLMNDTRPGKVPVAIILDDAAAIGHLPIIENTVAQMRGYGLKLITVWQVLGQIKAIYRERWEDFIGNAGIVQSFAAQDITTARYLSDMAGVTTEQFEGRSVSQNMPQKGAWASNTSASITPHQVPLIRPQQIAGMAPGHTIIFSDRFEGNERMGRSFCPYPTAIPDLEAICALDPSR